MDYFAFEVILFWASLGLWQFAPTTPGDLTMQKSSTWVRSYRLRPVEHVSMGAVWTLAEPFQRAFLWLVGAAGLFLSSSKLEDTSESWGRLDCSPVSDLSNCRRHHKCKLLLLDWGLQLSTTQFKNLNWGTGFVGETGFVGVYGPVACSVCLSSSSSKAETVEGVPFLLSCLWEHQPKRVRSSGCLWVLRPIRLLPGLRVLQLKETTHSNSQSYIVA